MKRHAVARAIAAAMIASTLLAGLANASGPAKAKGDEQGDEALARSMDAPYLAVPVVRNGQLVNYLFVSLRIEVAPGVDLWRTREQAHFLRDALVRAGHVNDLADPNDANLLNEARAIEVYRATAIQALGERAIGRVSVVSAYSSQGSGI
ncbi:MAG: hypothetical protein K2P58_12755 [Hyphomonadaceae bacterium]|nr:hypothetical protein [Hyphomonadaceae bacterium]